MAVFGPCRGPKPGGARSLNCCSMHPPGRSQKSDKSQKRKSLKFRRKVKQLNYLCKMPIFHEKHVFFRRFLHKEFTFLTILVKISKILRDSTNCTFRASIGQNRPRIRILFLGRFPVFFSSNFRIFFPRGPQLRTKLLEKTRKTSNSDRVNRKKCPILKIARGGSKNLFFRFFPKTVIFQFLKRLKTVEKCNKSQIGSKWLGRIVTLVEPYFKVKRPWGTIFGHFFRFFPEIHCFWVRWDGRGHFHAFLT